MKKMLVIKDRQLTDMNATLLVSLAHLSEAQDKATDADAQRKGRIPTRQAGTSRDQHSSCCRLEGF